MKKLAYGIFAVISLMLFAGAYYEILPTTIPEVLGFVTGVVCVWLVVKENMWNWPIGIANSAFFLYTFWIANLFADSMLQVVYIVLGFLGWYWWKFGGDSRKELTVGRVSYLEMILLAIAAGIGTVFMTQYLESIKDAAPFLDAVTTISSLVAQYLLSRKYLENWYVWIVTDVVYIYLYIIKGLYLTSVTYIVFLILCFIGLVAWRKTWNKQLDSSSASSIHSTMATNS
jgi:nicotinamide mononucleotide transporter